MAAILDPVRRSFSFAALAHVWPVQLTRIRRGTDRNIHFGPDEPAELHWAEHAEKWLDQQGKEHTARWYRHEVFVERGDPIEAGDTMMVCRFPLSRLQFDRVSFKRGSKKSTAQRPNLENTRFASEPDMKAWIDDLPNDYWEKGNRVVAGLSHTRKSFGGTPRMQRRSESGYAYAVTSEPIDHLVEELVHASRELLQWTEKRTLRAVPLAAARRGKTIQIDDELQAEGTSLLYLAACMALCGPQQPGISWRGEPVIRAVDKFYRNLVYDRFRMTASRRKLISKFVSADTIA